MKAFILLTHFLPAILSLSWGTAWSGKKKEKKKNCNPTIPQKKISLFLPPSPFKGYLIAIIFLQKKNLAGTCKVLTEIGMKLSGNGKSRRGKKNSESGL